MRQKYHLLFFILFFSSCTNQNDDTYIVNKEIDVTDDDNTVNNSQAKIDDIFSFFDIYTNSNYDRRLFFFENNNFEPVRWISVNDLELQDSRFIKLVNISVLVLVNPAETSINLFYKQKGKKVKSMMEGKYYPDNVTLKSMNDTLVICEFYWKYQIGPDLDNVREYYFIGEKTGIYKYAYSSSDFESSPLDIDNFVLRDNGILFEDKKYNDTLLVLHDTLKLLNSSNTDFVSGQFIIPFNKVSFEFDGWK